MCGIVGIFNVNGNINQNELDRFTDSLTHRGPDGRGTYIGTKIGLGHRRLAILDLSDAGQCPMQYIAPNGLEYWITFNGEVYNFIELRKELEQKGYQFKSQTDTEVVIASYAEWGEECLFKFNGMWALAIWSVQEEKLFLSRDRFGVKPLYYSVMSGGITFASEIKAFLSLNFFSPELNEDVVPLMLSSTFAYEGTTDQSTMKNVFKIPSGHVMTINKRGQISLKQWWNTFDHLTKDIPQTYQEQVELFHYLFKDAVRLRMRSDVPTGTALSGGVDSSSIVGQIANLFNSYQSEDLTRCFAENHTCFVATFPNSAMDEKIYADTVINYTKSKKAYWVFDDQLSAQYLPETIWTMEEVYGAIAIPIWALYKEMKNKNVLVSLDGHGGDELVGGYTFYLNWLSGQFDSNLYESFHSHLLPSILRNYDRCSMAHGIEVRMPFMDYRLVQYCFSLPKETKLGKGYTKRILRDSMKNIIPESIRLRRSKVGFNSPMVEWFNSGFIPVIEFVVNHKLWLDSKHWNGFVLRDFILSKSRSKSWTYKDWDILLSIWNCMNLVLWQLMFVEKISFEQLKLVK